MELLRTPDDRFANLAGYAYLTIFGAAVAYAIWFRGIRALPPTRGRGRQAAARRRSRVSSAVFHVFLYGETR